jgi:GT2 family glycosyltransferase
MNTHKFFVEKMRFHINEPNKVVFEGWFFDGSTKEHKLAVRLDGQELPLEIKINRGAEVRQKYISSINEIEEEVVGIITLPQEWRQLHKLVIESFWQQEKSRAYAVSVRKLLKLETEIPYYIENCHRGDGKITVTGWCVAEGETKMLLLAGEEPLQSQKVERYYRKDLMMVFPECDSKLRAGFMVQAEEPSRHGSVYLRLRAAEHSSRIKLCKWDEGSRLQMLGQKIENAVRYLKRNGIAATWYKVNSKVRKKELTSYDSWRKKYQVTPEELERQKQTELDYKPLFSIVVPLYKTRPEYLRALTESVLMQTYGNWELCMADGSANAQEKNSAELTQLLEEYAAKDARIRFCTLQENRGIAGNTNAALAMATGDFIVLADHDDILPANALFELAAAVNEDRSIDVLYSDEDKVSMDGKKYFEPHFKSDFNIDMLCSVNYICHLFAVKKEIVERAGQFDANYDGAQDYDFILRCCEQAKHVHHIPKILYHWRCHADSTAANPESKLYAFEAGRRAIEAHYMRLGIPAQVKNGSFYGLYRTIYQWEEEPLVSIIIPNKDHSQDLKKCMDSIYEKSGYRNFEFVIVENNSTEQETFDFYQQMQREHDNVTVVSYEGDFNYSRINNFGAAAAKGNYLLLLNNDTEMIAEDGIRELLGYCMRDDVGAVGAKLLYEDGTIQHAGVVVGFGGTAGHTFIGKSRYDTGYFGRILVAQDYSAVTAACMMTRKDVFDAVGGLTEEFAVAFNDIDYCLKVRRYGKLVVYNPYAEFYHYESKSRGLEDSPEKVERFQGETDRLLNTWRELVETGDPYYNPNLTLDNSDFSLRR